MSGLSYLQAGGQPDQQSNLSNTAVQVKPSAGRGRVQFPTVSGTIPAGASTLEAMEEMYQEMLGRQTGMRGFLESAKDAQAWWTPGGAQRAQALEGRTQARERQAAELFNMRSQLAQYKSAMEAQKAFEERRNRELGLGGGAGGASAGAPAAGSADAMFGMPPEIRQALMNARTREEYDTIYRDYAKKKAEVEASPEFDVPKIPVVTWNEEQGAWVRDVISARQLRANPKKYFNEDGTPATATPTPAPAPQAMPVPEPAGAAPATPLAEPAPIAPPPAPTPAAAAPKNYTFNELTPEQIQTMGGMSDDMGLIQNVMSRPDAAQLFDQLPLDKRRGVFNALQPEPAQVAAAPAPTMTDVAAPSVSRMTPPVPTQVAQAAPAPAARPPRPTASQLERRAEVEKEVDIAAEKQRLESDKVEREKFLNESTPTRVSERKVRATRVQKLVQEDPTIVGVLTQPDVRSALANVLQQGLSTPSGSISVKGLSDAIFQTLPTTIDLKKRREIAGYIAQMELDASQAMNGQGQISDGERDIIRAASISIEDPAEVVYKKAKMMQLRQETLQQLRSIYGDGSKYTRNFAAFENDPRYQKIAADYEAKLQAIADEDVVFDRSMVGKIGGAKGQKGAKPSTVQPYTDADKERRYQEWKRSQGR